MKFFIFRLSTLKKIALCTLLLALTALTFETGSIAGVYFGQSLKRVPIYSVETAEPMVAISFDAAWGADKTERIMEILKEHDVDATFFLVGFWVDKYKEMVKKISDNGFEIGTHTNTHPDLTKFDAERIKLELSTSCKAIEEITGKPVELFRAPYGAYNDTVLDEAEKLKLKTIQWDVDSLDWKGLSAKDISMRVISGVKNGSIVLFHNNSDNILDALVIILETLKSKGYKIVSVGDLVIKENYTIDHMGRQKANS